MNAMPPHLAQERLRQCRELLDRDLNEWIEDLGPALAEELLTLAGASRDNSQQREYLDLRSVLQNHWDSLSSQFAESLSRQLQPLKVVTSAGSAAPNYDQLQLVDDQELTERIVMREFTRRVSEACSEETYALDRRLAHLLGQNDDEYENEVGPQIVCNAIRAGCETLQPKLDGRILLLRQIERHLQAELPQVYRAINEVLIEADILPELKRSYRRAVPAGTLAPAADASNILGTMQRLAASRQQGDASAAPPAGSGAAPSSGGGGGGGGAMMAGSLPASAVFLESLISFRDTPISTEGLLTNVVRQARDSEEARSIPPLEAITLDIVATLFDLIFDDEKVPNAVKGLVSRLQIPVLKVAMLDQQFFADRSHPARRFLDGISGIAIRWGRTVNEDDPFYIKLAELVETIHDRFDQDVEVFASAIAELAEFVNAREVLETETTRLAAEVVQRKEAEQSTRREQQVAARKSADAALETILTAELPRPVSQFLRGHWRAVLQKIALEKGAEADSFRTAENIAKELAWSVIPKTTAQDRRRLVVLLPKLLPGIHHGLNRIGTSTEARRPILDALMALHAAALRADEAAQQAVADLETPPPSPAEPAVLQVTAVVEQGIRIEEVSLPQPEEDGTPPIAAPQDRALQRQVKHLVRGDWVEFDEGEKIRRERLTWISPRRSLYLFSNHTTHCAISITPDALAHRLQEGSARIVERDAPMFERALDGAIKVLDEAS